MTACTTRCKSPRKFIMLSKVVTATKADAPAVLFPPPPSDLTCEDFSKLNRPRAGYFSVFTNSAIAPAWVSSTPEMLLLCGVFFCGSPLVRNATISSALLDVPFRAGAFIAGLPSPLVPWQVEHFCLYKAAPSAPQANGEDAIASAARTNPILSDLFFI
jgi:hypothetical protein